MSTTNKAKQNLVDWSEHAINLAELQANGIEVNWAEHLALLEGIVKAAKASGMTLDDVSYLTWSYSLEAEIFYSPELVSFLGFGIGDELDRRD